MFSDKLGSVVSFSIQRSGSALAALALLALSTVSAYGGVVYSTGFEPPTYSLGNLTGQDGWQEFSNGIVTVENFQVQSGTQAVFVNGSGGSPTLQSGPFHADSAGSLVDLSADIFLASSSKESSWQFAATGANLTGYAGGIDIDANTGAVHLIATGFPAIAGLTFTRDVWHQVDLLLNYTTQTYSFSLDGTVEASNIAFCGTNGACTGATVSAYADGFFDTFGGAGNNDSGFLDNYSVSTVPEPTALSLAGMGMAALIVALRKRSANSAN